MPDEHPYGDDDGEEGGAAANARLVQEMNQDMTGADEDQNVQVEVGAPVHDEPDDDEPRGSRRQRRSERGRNHRLQANDDRDAARAETAKLREEMAEMRGHMAGCTGDIPGGLAGIRSSRMWARLPRSSRAPARSGCWITGRAKAINI